MDLDLDINNYSLDDLLKLFKLTSNFSKHELDKSKKILYKLHPDKCNLPDCYFLFFKRAYKILEDVYSFRCSRTKSTTYSLDEDDDSRKIIIEKIKNRKNFNKWFNKMFDETVNIDDNNKNAGYGDWLSGDVDTFENVDKNMLLKTQKEKCKSIQKYNGIDNIEYTAGNSLSLEKPDSYESGIFSNLKYDDIKRVYDSETVIPIDENDIDQNKLYDNVENLISERSIDINMLSEKESHEILNNNKSKEDDIATNLAYSLIRQSEQVEKSNNNWWSKVKQLKY